MIKHIAILILCALLIFQFVPPPRPVQAAIAQTATGTQAVDDSSPVTMAFDCNGGDLLVVGICVLHHPRVGGVPTYDGVAMTDSGQGIVDSGSESIVEMFYLVNPAGGSNAISVPNTAERYLVPIASAWSGVDTVDPLDTSDSDSANTSANPSLQVTTSAANELVIDVMMSGHPDVPSANSHTLISSQDNGSDTSNAQYTTAQSPAGNITLSWTVADEDWAMIVAAFKVAGAPPAGDIEAVACVTYDPDVEKVGCVARADIQEIAGVAGQ